MPANGEHDHDHAGHDHEGHDHGESPETFDPSKMTEAELLEAMKAQFGQDVYERGVKALETYKEKTESLRKTVTEMRLAHTKIRNGLLDDESQYSDLRNAARQEIRASYRAALDVLEYMPYGNAMQFVNTMIQNRMKHGVYDAETKEGAAKLLDYHATYVHLAQAAARSATMTGDFATAERIYEKLDPEKEMEDLDRRFAATMAELKEQYEAEQILLDSDPADLPKVRLETTRGDILIELYINEAPSTASNFIRLVEDGFYDGLDFFQVVDDVLAITGDPLGDGSSIPDKFIADEEGRPTIRMPLYGSLVAAKLPVPDSRDFIPNSAGTQFAILFSPLPHIARSQTIFGRVIEGFDVIGSFQRVDPSKPKKKNEIAFPPDRIIQATVINRPEQLPEVNYVDPTAGASAPVANMPELPPLDLGESAQ